MQYLLQQLLLTRRKHSLIVVAGFSFWFCVLIAARLQPFVPINYLTRDPSAVASYPLYYGAFSNIGVLLWGSSVAVCLLSVMLLKVFQPGSEAGRFFTVFGWFNAVLCFDDLFLFHEKIFPKLVFSPDGSRVAEGAVLFTYVVIFIGWLIRFRKLCLKTKPALLGLSLLLFSISLGSDLFSDLPPDDGALLEDGTKLLAIFVWFAYFLWAAVDLVVVSAIAAMAQAAELSVLPSVKPSKSETAAIQWQRLSREESPRDNR